MRWTLCLLFLFAACSDDTAPSGPGGGTPEPGVDWFEAGLPTSIGDGAVVAVASNTGRDLALALGSTGAWVLERSGSSWEKTGAAPLPGTGPLSFREESAGTDFALDLAISDDGRAVVVGASPSAGTPVIWFETLEGWERQAGSGYGGLRSVAATGGDRFTATGMGAGTLLVATGSFSGGVQYSNLTTDGIPAEKSLVDLAATGEELYAVGFDDGADGTPEQPHALAMMRSGGSWSQLPSPCEGCSNREFRAVAASDGAVWIGGTLTNWSAGAADHETAWLVTSPTAGETWSEILLPDRGELDRVDDILVSSQSEIYLACGTSGGAIVRLAPDEQMLVEWTDTSIRLLALAELSDGTIVAAGIEGSDPGRPVLLIRPDTGP